MRSGAKRTLCCAELRVMFAGIALCVAVASAALLTGLALPLVGAPVLAILLGIVVAAVRAPGAGAAPGIRFCSR
ncbi:MAG: hypothetical protein NVS1B14_04240 [Vulcanimicrobiaceae bacterium]